jgi:hypothetical protein
MSTPFFVEMSVIIELNTWGFYEKNIYRHLSKLDV